MTPTPEQIEAARNVIAKLRTQDVSASEIAKAALTAAAGAGDKQLQARIAELEAALKSIADDPDTNTEAAVYARNTLARG